MTAVTEPNSWPSSPTFASTLTVAPSRAAFIFSASAMRFSSRFAMLCLRCSSCLRFPFVAKMASFWGSR